MTVAPTSVPHGAQHHRARWVLLATLAFLLGGLAVAMLYHFDVLGGSAGSASSGSATEGSGVSATQARQVAAFSSVELAGSNNVLIHVGDRQQQSVVVKGDDNLLQRVTTEVHSGELVIGNTPGNLSANTPMSVEVTVPALTALTLSGAGNIAVDGIGSQNLEVSLAGSGNLAGSGAATRLDITVGGSGTVQFAHVVADNVRAVVSGDGSIFVTATRSLDGSISGDGAIVYTGNPPDVTKNVTGTGAITGR
jgi:Putative auto-transporter adhesin, head GIN domain